jgi:hypothetical protein
VDLRNISQFKTDPLYLLTRPVCERAMALERSAKAAANLYAGDLALPLGERELLAFEHIDDFMEPDDYLSDRCR